MGGNLGVPGEDPTSDRSSRTDALAMSSEELQAVADSACTATICGLKFSVTVARPQLQDCPLVACSSGFSDITGYYVEEIVGKNCRFLLEGVPADYVSEDTRRRCRSFCAAAALTCEAKHKVDKLPDSLKQPWVSLPDGEILCVQTNARKTGELFQNMFYMREVDLNLDRFILGLQAELPPHFSMDELAASENSFQQLNANMDTLQQVLAASFWCSGPMRRQGIPS
mmetsp:Transcript_7726/g.21104  ORF Transcript_7726/g.21104 Transcript_7726/m.21104 type:complete len:226 (-) Transcript_7726:130-807(-)